MQTDDPAMPADGPAAKVAPLHADAADGGSAEAGPALADADNEAAAAGEQGAAAVEDATDVAAGMDADENAGSPDEDAAATGAGAEAADAGDESAVAAAHPLVQEFLRDPSGWGIWTAVAMLRWMMRSTPSARRLVYRSRPSLNFSASEILDVGVGDEGFNLLLAAPGLAAPGSALPLADVARIAADMDRAEGGALAYWLDGLADRLMHAVEVAEARTNTAFALATGGTTAVVDSVLMLAGYSAPLFAEPGGVLHGRTGTGMPVPALARMFVGEATAAGLESLVSGFTGLDVDVEEFIPVEMSVASPQRVGSTMNRSAIGREGEVDAAVNVILDGTKSEEAAAWVRDPARAEALESLCTAYVGGASPEVLLYVELSPENIPPAALDGATAFGRGPLLGVADEVTLVPIESSARGAVAPERAR